MAIIASSTRSPSARINEPSVIRSKSLPVAAMTTNTAASVRGTAAATTMPTRHPMLRKDTSITTPRAKKNLTMNSSTAVRMLTDWSVTLERLVPSGHLRVDRRRFRFQRLAQLEAVPRLAHDHAEQQGRFAVVADQEGRRIFIAALDVGDVGERERTALRGDGGIPDRFQIVDRAVQPDEDLRPLDVDRARWRHDVPAVERGEEISG